MNFETIYEKLMEIRQIAFTYKLATPMLNGVDEQPLLIKLSEKLSELVEELTQEFEKNKKSLTKELETMVADQLTGIEMYANMPEWQIELFESIKAPTINNELIEQDKLEEDN